MPATDVKTLGVIGAGTMGRGIAETAAAKGINVLLSDVEVPVGDSTVTVRFRRADERSGSVEVAIGDVDAGNAPLPLFMRMISSVGSSIGHDHGSAVSPRYAAPFAFQGTLHELVIQLAEGRQPGLIEVEARAEMSRQ